MLEEIFGDMRMNAHMMRVRQSEAQDDLWLVFAALLKRAMYLCAAEFPCGTYKHIDIAIMMAFHVCGLSPGLVLRLLRHTCALPLIDSMPWPSPGTLGMSRAAVLQRRTMLQRQAIAQ